MRELKTISPDSIDYNDKRFDFRNRDQTMETEKPNELPVVWENGVRYIPVICNKMKKTDSDTINALVYSSDCTYESILSDLVTFDQPDLFDIAGIVCLLEKYAPDHDKEIWSKKMRIGKGQWTSIKELSRYEAPWKQYFISKNIPLKRMLHFSQKEIRELLVPLLDMNPGINLLESIAMLLNDISRIENDPVSKVWEKIATAQILTDKELSSSQKLQEIRKALYEIRYPTIARYREQMDKHLRNIAIPHGVTLRIDENFETPGMQVQAEIKSNQDLDTFKTWLESESNKLEKIVDIQKGKK